MAAVTDVETYPGQSLGLPAKGPGSLARWGSRLGALVLAVYFVQKAVLTALTGSSFGQLISRIGVTRVDGTPIGALRAIARSAMVCLVVPAVVIGPDRRGINDLLLGTVVVNRR